MLKPDKTRKNRGIGFNFSYRGGPLVKKFWRMLTLYDAEFWQLYFYFHQGGTATKTDVELLLCVENALSNVSLGNPYREVLEDVASRLRLLPGKSPRVRPETT